MKIDPLHVLLNTEFLPSKKFFFIGGNEITLMEKISDVIIKRYKEIENPQILNINSIDGYVNESGLFEDKKIIIGKECKGINEKSINNIRDIGGIFIFKHENSAKSRSIKKQFSKDKDCCFIDCYEIEKDSKVKIINNFLSMNNLKIKDEVYWFLVEKIHNKYAFIENTFNNILALETKELTFENIKKILTVDDSGKNKLFFNLLKKNDEIIYIFREKILSSADANEFFYFCRFYCQQIIDHRSEKGINNENLAKLIGKSSSHVSNILRLLELDKKIQQMVINGDLSMGHARALIGVPDAINKAKEIIEKKLSVRQIEKITSEFKKNKTKKNSKDPNIIDLEKELSDKIGLKTSIQFNENGSSGSLTLYYSDLNQLDDLMKRLKK